MASRKRCSRCNQVQPVSEFWACRRSPDGLQTWCQDCYRAYRREYRAAGRIPASSQYPELNDHAWVHERYCRDLLTIREIAQLLGCGDHSVKVALKRFQISTIPDGPRRWLRGAVDQGVVPVKVMA